DHHPARAELQHRVGRPPHLLLRAHADAGELLHLVEVGGGDGRRRQQLRAHRVQRGRGQQRVPVLGDPHRVHDRGHAGARDQVRHRLHEVGRGEHAGLDRLHADVVHHTAVLGPHRLHGQLPGALHTEGVLRGHRGEHAHAVHTEGQHRLQVRLDARPAAGVGPGHGQHPGRCGRGAHDSMSPKWSQPPLLVQGAPSTVTWGSAEGLSTSPITFQRAGSFTSGGKVATMAWSSPPVSTHCMGSTPTAWPMSFIWDGMSTAPERTSMRTLLASAMCPRSAISPSLTSHIAVAPSPAAAGPAWYGGSGRRWASTKARGERKPRESTAWPAADQPSQPVTATRSPGWAPDRVTGSWLRRSPSAVIDTMIWSPRTTSPPTTAAPATWHSSRRPSMSSL